MLDFGKKRLASLAGSLRAIVDKNVWRIAFRYARYGNGDRLRIESLHLIVEIKKKHVLLFQQGFECVHVRILAACEATGNNQVILGNLPYSHNPPQGA